MTRAVLFDTTKCIGCRGCQVACKEENRNPAEPTEFFARPGGYQNPAALSARTFTLVSYHELDVGQALPKWVFVRRQCMHCVEAACVANCPVNAMQKEDDGTVSYDQTKCIGCGTCVSVCPFGIPVLEQQEAGPRVLKCTFCADRVRDAQAPDVLNEGHPTPDVLDESKKARHLAHGRTPACVAACPTGALQHGDREALLTEAHRRIRQHPERYVDHVYGESEAGGTAWLYLAAVPFADLRMRTRFEKRAGSAVGLPGTLALGAVACGWSWYERRRQRLTADDAADDDERDRCSPPT
jgi:formate dehydrogenase iron-sulfur subunit